MRNIKLIFTFTLLLFLCLLVPPSIYAAQTINLAGANSYNIRILSSNVSQGGATKVISSGTDFDNDGKADLVVALSAGGNSGTYIIPGRIIETYTTKPSAIDLDINTTYWVKYSDAHGFYHQESGDFDGDGKPDLALTTGSAIYIIYNSVINTHLGTGNSITLASNPSEWNIRIDKTATSPSIRPAIGGTPDIDSNGKSDLVLNDPGYTSPCNACGVLYIIRDSIISPYQGTGNILSLGTSTDYNIRYELSVGSGSPNLGIHGVIFEDVNGNGIKDLITSSQDADPSGRTNAGEVYIVYDSIFSAITGTGNSKQIDASANHTARLIGAAASNHFSVLLSPGDVDQIGTVDLAIGANGADFQSVSGVAGSAYIIPNSLISSFVGTGNTVDMATSSNYTLRIDGPADGGDYAAFGSTGDIADYNNDGINDLIVSHSSTDYNGLTNAGSVYVFYSNLLDDYTGTGNVINLAATDTFSVRIDGALNSQQLYKPAIRRLNSDASKDMLLGGFGGYRVYTIYNFPHTFSSLGLSGPMLSGRVDTSNSTTSLAGVQYSIDSNDFNAGWTSCTIYGNEFNCQLTPLSGNHTIYVRAYDTNTSYTAQNNYGQFCFGNCPNSSNSSSGGGDPNSQPNWSKLITVGPKRIGSVGTKGYLFNQGVGAFMNNNITPIDLYINPGQTTNISTQGLNTCSPVYDFRAVSSFNGYPVLTSTLPYTIVLNHTPGTNCNRIAFLNQQTNKWQILPRPYVNNPVNQTLATSTNQFSYFVVVSSYNQPVAQKKKVVTKVKVAKKTKK